MESKKFMKLLRKGIKKKFGWIAELFKKLLKTFLVLCVILSAATIFHFYTNETLIADTLIYYTFDEDQYINSDMEIAKEIMNFIDRQDPVIKDRFFRQNWKIIFDDEVPISLRGQVDTLINFEEDNNYSLKGLTIPKGKFIYINTNNSDEIIYETFIHEFGHFIDYQFGYTSITNQFEEIYNIYDNSPLYDKYQLVDSTEFFAESYVKYRCEPGLLKERLPEVYSYMENILDNPEQIDGPLGTLKSGVLGFYIQLKVNFRLLKAEFWV